MKIFNSSTLHALQLRVDAYASFLSTNYKSMEQIPRISCAIKKKKCGGNLQLKEIHSHFCIHWSEVCMFVLLYFGSA